MPPDGLKQKIALVFLGLLIFFAMFELAMHLVSGLNTSPPLCAFEADANNNYVLRANFETTHKTGEFEVPVKINSMGLRSNEYNQNEGSVLVAGDSLAFGWGVQENETFGSLLEKKFRSNGRAIQVINAAVPGYNTANEVDFYKRIAAKTNPCVGILALYIGNDIVDNYAPPPEVEVNPSYCLVTKAAKKEFNLLDEINKNALSLRFFSERLKRLPIVRGLLVHAGISGKGEIQLQNQLYLRHPTVDIRQLVEPTEQAILEFKKFSELHGIKPILLILPSHTQVLGDPKNNPHIADSLALYGISPDEVDFSIPGNTFKDFGERNGVAVIDLLPRLQKADVNRLAYPIDGHPTPYMHGIISEELYSQLGGTAGMAGPICGNAWLR